MFSNLILRNSKRNRKENGLFFGSLIISIVAFFIILSLSRQDVMVFLAKMESDCHCRRSGGGGNSTACVPLWCLQTGYEGVCES